MTDLLEFHRMNPFAEGEPWATDFSEGVQSAVAIMINGKDLCDHLRTFEGKNAHAYGHNTPAELYRELSAAAARGSYSWYEGAELLCCIYCGLTDCYRVDTFVTVEDETVFWCIRSRNVKDSFLFFSFEKTAYLRAMQELYVLAGEPTDDRLAECSNSFTLYHAVLRFYMPRTREGYQQLCALAGTLGVGAVLDCGHAHGQTGLHDYLRQVGFSETTIKSSGVCELPDNALLQPLYEDGCWIVGITALAEQLTTRFGGVLPEEGYIERRKQHGI